MMTSPEIQVSGLSKQLFGLRLVSVCAWCERLKAPDGTWLRSAELKHLKRCRRITHGICPDCQTELMQQTFKGSSAA